MDQPRKHTDVIATKYIISIRDILAGITSPFYCTGRITLESSPAILFPADNVLFNITPNDTNNLNLLLDRFSPAPFGEGSITKLDPNIRNALQLKAIDNSFNVINFDTSSILKEVSKQLLQLDSSDNLIAEPYALNAYKKGGFFKSHKDTPRGENMIGTLVIILPSEYTGGDLYLHHQGHVRRALWGIPLQTAPKLIRWAAFFGDVDHSVRPVEDGIRLTLTYILRRTSTSPLPPKPTKNDALKTCLKEALYDDKFLVKGGTLAFPCHYMYSKEDLFGKSTSSFNCDTPLNDTFISKLKGRDALIASLMLGLNLDVYIHPYLIESSADTRWHLSELPSTNVAKKKLGKRVDSDKLGKIFSGIEQVGWDYKENVIWIEDPPKSSNSNKKKPRIDHNAKSTEDEEPAMEHLGSFSFSEDGYFGNEASDSDFYIYLSLHIKIPAVGKYQRLIVPVPAAVEIPKI